MTQSCKSLSVAALDNSIQKLSDGRDKELAVMLGKLLSESIFFFLLPSTKGSLASVIFPVPRWKKYQVNAEKNIASKG